VRDSVASCREGRPVVYFELEKWSYLQAERGESLFCFTRTRAGVVVLERRIGEFHSFIRLQDETNPIFLDSLIPVRNVPVNYAMRFSGPVTALTASGMASELASSASPTLGQL
jgi:hypothetical protein